MFIVLKRKEIVRTLIVAILFAACAVCLSFADVDRTVFARAEKKLPVYRVDVGEEKTIAIFCHGGASAAFLARVLNQQFPYMCGVLLNFPHTTITVLKFDETPGTLTLPIIELMNDSRHLREVK